MSEGKRKKGAKAYLYEEEAKREGCVSLESDSVKVTGCDN